jgi:hypothetical protein
MARNGITTRSLNKATVALRYAWHAERNNKDPRLQTDLDGWLQEYNEQRPHQGRWCYGKTPRQTFIDSVSLAKEKMLAA